ncbi:MAG: MFS transporter, partial [Kiritimatiellaeota bacterium]|nr:MFS transporter [Kiritimatiellota bacterium]
MFQRSGQRMRRREVATLGYSYAGETGRGVFQAVGADFAMVVAVSHFGTNSVFLLWLLNASPFVGYLFSLFSAPLTRFGRKKSLVLGFEAISRFLVLAAVLARNAAGFIVPMALARACANMASPLISGIYGANFCDLSRGPAVGRLQMLRMATVALCGGLFAGAMRAGGAGQFRPLGAAAAAATLFLAVYTWRLPEGRPARNPGDANSLRDCFGIMTGDGAFMFFEFSWFLLGLANLVIWPIKVLRLHDLGYSDSAIMLCTTTTMFAAMVSSMPIWGRLLYRMNFAVYRAVTNLFIMAGILVFFRGRSPVAICLGSALWGIGLAGGGLCWRLVATFFTRPDRGPAYMSIHTFLCGIRGIIGPLLGLHGYRMMSIERLSAVSLGLMGTSTVLVLCMVPA